MRVVLVSPSGRVAEALDQLGLPSADDEVSVIAWSPLDAQIDGVEEFVLELPKSRVESALTRLLDTNRIGRYLHYLLWDRGRKLQREVRSQTDVRTALAGADVIIAAERTGIVTAWYASRHWTSEARVVNGVVPAATLLQVERRIARQTG